MHPSLVSHHCPPFSAWLLFPTQFAAPASPEDPPLRSAGSPASREWLCAPWSRILSLFCPRHLMFTCVFTQPGSFTSVALFCVYLCTVTYMPLSCEGQLGCFSGQALKQLSRRGLSTSSYGEELLCQSVWTRSARQTQPEASPAAVPGSRALDNTTALILPAGTCPPTSKSLDMPHS